MMHTNFANAVLQNLKKKSDVLYCIMFAKCIKKKSSYEKSECLVEKYLFNITFYIEILSEKFCITKFVQVL